MKNFFSHKAQLLFIFFCGSVLTGINATPLVNKKIVGFDEAYSIYLAARPHAQGAFIDLHMTLYNYLLFFNNSFFGPSLYYSKILSVFFFILLVFLLTKYFLNRVGFFPTFFLILFITSSPKLLPYLTMTRSYSLLIFFSTATVLSNSLLLEKFSYKRWLLYFFSSVFLIFSHTIGFFIVFVNFIGQILTLLLTANDCWASKKRNLLKSITTHALVSITYLPILLRIFNSFNYWEDIPQIYSWVSMPKFSKIYSWVYKFSLTDEGFWICLFFISLSLLNVFQKRKTKVREVFILCILWLWIPPLILYVYSRLHTPIFISRGLVSGIIPFAILITLGLQFLLKQKKRFATGIAFVLSLYLLTINRTHSDHRNPSFFHFNFSKILFEKRRLYGAQSIPIYFYPNHLKYNMALFFSRKCIESEHLETCLKKQNINSIENIHEHIVPTGNHILFLFEASEKKLERLIEKIHKKSNYKFLLDFSEHHHKVFYQ